MTELYRPDVLVNDAKVMRWLAANQWLDLFVSVGIATLLWWQAGDSALGSLDGIGRRAAYQTVAGFSATLLGLTMTTISILAGNMDKPLGGAPKGMPASLVVGLARPMFGLMRACGLAALGALVLLVTDTGSDVGTAFAQPILGAALVAIVLRMVRVLGLLSNLLRARNTK